MKIKDRPEFKSKPAPFTLQSSDLVSTAVKTMAEKNIGSVVIIDSERRVEGIVTERDLLRRLLYDRLNPLDTKLADIMTSEVKTAGADDNMIEWLRQMSNERFRHLPVVDSDGRLITMMSQGDFVSYAWPDLLYQLKEKAKDGMKSPAAPVPILIAGVMLYTLIILMILKFVGR